MAELLSRGACRNWRLAVASVALGLASGAAVAQFRGCPVDDSACLNDVYDSRCAERGTNAGSCQALASELQAQWSVTPTTAIGETLGSAFYRLADLALDERDRATEAAYRTLARQIYLDVVAADESAAGALTMLSILDGESLSDSIAWARRAVAARRSWIVTQGFVSMLFEAGTPQAISEAVEVAESDYANAEPGPDTWRGAVHAHNTYRRAGREFPGIVAPGAADDFLDRVRQDNGWDVALRALDDPARRPAAVRDALVTICGLARVFGDEPCLRGIETTVDAAIRSSGSPDAQILADAAAFGMVAAPQGGGIATPDTMTPRLIAWLDDLVDRQLDSLNVLNALATVSRDRERRLEARREIVSRMPNSGEARFELGKMLYDQRFWAEALVELEIAGELSPPENQLRIGSYLRQAEYEARNEAD